MVNKVPQTCWASTKQLLGGLDLRGEGVELVNVTANSTVLLN